MENLRVIFYQEPQPILTNYKLINVDLLVGQ